MAQFVFVKLSKLDMGLHCFTSLCWLVVGFPAGLSRPKKSRDGPGTGRDRTGQDTEGPGTKKARDLASPKVLGLPGPFFKY